MKGDITKLDGSVVTEETADFEAYDEKIHGAPKEHLKKIIFAKYKEEVKKEYIAAGYEINSVNIIFKLIGRCKYNSQLVELSDRGRVVKISKESLIFFRGISDG